MPPRLLRSLLALPLLLAATTGCADVRDRVDTATDTARDRVEQVTNGARELADRTRFCLDLARTVTAIEAGSPATAADAAEGVLAQAPDDLREDARRLVERLRVAGDDVDGALDDPELRRIAERLHERTRELCDPTAG